MKLIRYLDNAGKIHYAAEQAGGAQLRMEGDPFGKSRVTQETANIAKVLAPVLPVIIPWPSSKDPTVCKILAHRSSFPNARVLPNWTMKANSWSSSAKLAKT